MVNAEAVIKVFVLSAAAFAVTIAWTPLLAHYLYKYRLGKQIRDEVAAPVFFRLHQHKSGTPTMGGMLVWVTTLAFALVLAWIADVPIIPPFIRHLNFLSRSETLLPLGAMVASAIVGLIDDFYNVKRQGSSGGGLSMGRRLLIYTVIAVVGAWWFYFKLQWTTLHVPFLGSFDIGFWYVPIFIFIIVATSFSVNEIDGLDGLAGGTLLAAFVAFGAIAFAQGKTDLAAFLGVIVGALLAFLWFNINPARFFMGDTGAMSLGVTLGIVALLTNAVLLLPVIGGLFVIESLSVLVQVSSKRLAHRKVFRSSPLHHHLEAIGWPEPKIVMRFWVIAAVFAVIGVVLYLADPSYR